MRVAQFYERMDLFGALRGRVGVELRDCTCRYCREVERLMLQPAARRSA